MMMKMAMQKMALQVLQQVSVGLATAQAEVIAHL